MIKVFGNGDSLGGVNIFSRDVFLSLLLVVITMLVVLLMLINPKSKHQASEVDVPAGSIWVESYWMAKDPATGKIIDTDSDQGVWYRGDGANRQAESPIWFSNLGGKTYNLERDDRGNRPGWDDWDPINYEVTKSRGVPVGETCVNLHLYENNSSLKEIPVLVTVRKLEGTLSRQRDSITSSSKPILTANVKLSTAKREVNVFCFTIDTKGELVKEKTFQSDTICFHNANYCD